MKKISTLIFSSVTAIFLLIILMTVLGIGTFVEDRYDTATARYFIYNSVWFEFLFLLMIINFIGHIKKYDMLRKEKIGGLIFHLSFIVMIIGAATTRYFGFEGYMHIREGETSNMIYSSEPYLHLSYSEKNNTFKLSQLIDQPFQVNVPSAENKIDINFKEEIKNAIEQIQENVADGVDMIELVLANNQNQDTIHIENREIKNIGNIDFSYNSNYTKEAITVVEQNSKLMISSPYLILITNINGEVTDTIQPNAIIEFKKNYGYHTHGAIFFYANFYKSASKKIVGVDSDQSSRNALLLDITINGKTYPATLFGGLGHIPKFNDFIFGDVTLSMAYGDYSRKIPFSIHLQDFKLERYAGSESPSSYASEVTLIDNRNNFKQDYHIFMNHVLDYDKYRFFQSSYDKDEKGTMLSVSYDYWGTRISYFGYSLLTLGFIITLFMRNSRFLSLGRLITEIRDQRKNSKTDLNSIDNFESSHNPEIVKKPWYRSFFMILCIGGLPWSAYTQIQPPVDADHADKIGHLITQAPDGRFEPVHSMVYDVMHKIAKKDDFYFEGKGHMDAMQVFVDMIMDPEYWNNQNILYIKEQSVKDFIGVTGTHARLLDFFDKNNHYLLKDVVAEAFRKKQSEQSQFDKEIIKVDERLNILIYVIRGRMLKIFPEQNSKNNLWISWDEPAAEIPLAGPIKIINENLQLETLNYSNLMMAYLGEILNGVKLGDYANADKILKYISAIQAQHSDIIPSDRKINAEVFYNKAKIFVTLKNWYALLSVILLILAFIDVISIHKRKIIRNLLTVTTIILAFAFLYQTFGMILRWYLLGHAPWTNGYETLLLISWGGLLAGFCFAKYSKLTLAATALLAFFTLMTANHSNYDPQLTSLQPVLKSYWLIFHVATLTISYGFFGLAFILGIMNLFIYLFKTERTPKNLGLLVKELSYISEMNLTIGLVLATIGTFLGGIWANESWGRYWGWDAKETWSLIITLAYTLVIHLRFIPKLNNPFVFNVASIMGFGSVLMTFFGVNYYMSKGLHSYASGSTPIFPLWAWITILSILALIVITGIKEFKSIKNDQF